MQRAILCIFAVFFCSEVALGAELPREQGEKDRTSYSLGYQIGGDFQQQQMELHAEAFLQGLEDALAAAKPQLSPEKMHTTLADLKSRIVAEKKRQQLAALQKYRDEGRTFMAQNAKKEGVTVLPSGSAVQGYPAGDGENPGAQRPGDRALPGHPH